MFKEHVYPRFVFLLEGDEQIPSMAIDFKKESQFFSGESYTSAYPVIYKNEVVHRAAQQIGARVQTVENAPLDRRFGARSIDVGSEFTHVSVVNFGNENARFYAVRKETKDGQSGFRVVSFKLAQDNTPL